MATTSRFFFLNYKITFAETFFIHKFFLQNFKKSEGSNFQKINKNVRNLQLSCQVPCVHKIYIFRLQKGIKFSLLTPYYFTLYIFFFALFCSLFCTLAIFTFILPFRCDISLRFSHTFLPLLFLFFFSRNKKLFEPCSGVTSTS